MNELIPSDAFEILGYSRNNCPPEIKVYIDKIYDNNIELEIMISSFKNDLRNLEEQIENVSNQYKEFGETAAGLGLSLLNSANNYDGSVDRRMSFAGGLGVLLGITAIVAGEKKKEKEREMLAEKKKKIIMTIKKQKRMIAEKKLPHLKEIHKNTKQVFERFENKFWEQSCELVNWKDSVKMNIALNTYLKRVESFQNIVFYRYKVEEEMIDTYSHWMKYEDYSINMEYLNKDNSNIELRTYWNISKLLLEYATSSNEEIPVVLIDTFLHSSLIKQYIAKPSSSSLNSNGGFTVDSNSLECIFPRSLTGGCCYDESTNSFKNIDKEIWFGLLRKNNLIVEFASACDEMKRLNQSIFFKGKLWHFPKIFEQILSEY